MNATTIESLGDTMETRPARPKLLYPALVIAAISVTLFSLLGIAALTGIMPSAHSTPQAAVTGKAAPAEKSARTATAPKTTSAATSTAQHAAASCTGCGMVESVATVERPASTTGVGAVAGGLTGALLGNQIGRGNGRTVMTLAGGAGGAYLGNKVEQNTRRVSSYKIVVRMENGNQRTVYQTEAPNVAVGGQVQIVGNAVVPRS